MQFVNNGLVNIQVNIINIGIDGCVNIQVADLPLPGESHGGTPPIVFGESLGVKEKA